MQAVDYLVIGHICRDLTPAGPSLGGTATFSALTARALGRRVGILTSSSETIEPLLAPLEGIARLCVPAEYPTTFENVYTPAGRIQTIWSRATPLNSTHVPQVWCRSAIVHLAPVAAEVDPGLAACFPGALLGVTPQGWMRRWDERGRVSYRPWVEAAQVLPWARAVVLSIEDVQGDEQAVRELAHQVALVALTRGPEGSTLFENGRPHHIPAPRVVERDVTGAGDIYAAAFFVHLEVNRDPLAAARFATRLASDSVTRVGLDSIPSPATVQAILAEM